MATTVAIPVARAEDGTTIPEKNIQDSTIWTTSRDSIALSLKPHAPLALGIGENGFELFHTDKSNSGLTLDSGLLAINSPPGELKISKVSRDLNSKAQAYAANFLGVAVSRQMSDDKSYSVYAGKDLSGGILGGMRYQMPVSENATLVTDLHLSRHMTAIGAFYNWDKTKNDTNWKLNAGFSLRNTEPVVSMAYSIDHKHTLQEGGYLRTIFTASAAVDKQSRGASVGVAFLKDVASFNLLGVMPATVEAGVGVQADKGRNPQAKLVWQLKL